MNRRRGKYEGEEERSEDGSTAKTQEGRAGRKERRMEREEGKNSRRDKTVGIGERQEEREGENSLLKKQQMTRRESSR